MKKFTKEQVIDILGQYLENEFKGRIKLNNVIINSFEFKNEEDILNIANKISTSSGNNSYTKEQVKYLVDMEHPTYGASEGISLNEVTYLKDFRGKITIFYRSNGEYTHKTMKEGVAIDGIEHNGNKLKLGKGQPRKKLLISDKDFDNVPNVRNDMLEREEAQINNGKNLGNLYITRTKYDDPGEKTLYKIYLNNYLTIDEDGPKYGKIIFKDFDLVCFDLYHLNEELGKIIRFYKKIKTCYNENK